MNIVSGLSNSKVDSKKSRDDSIVLKPKTKEQMLQELNNLRAMLGLHKTDGTMKATRNIIQKEGSLLDVLDEVKKRERQ